MKELCVKTDLRKVIILISFQIFFIFMFYLYKSVKCVFNQFFLIKMYAHNKNIYLKLRNICFTKFIGLLKITSQVIRFALQFVKCEARICTLWVLKSYCALGSQPPPQHHLLFLAKPPPPPPKSANSPSPTLFKQSPPSILVFCEPPPLFKRQILQ